MEKGIERYQERFILKKFVYELRTNKTDIYIVYS